MRGCYEKSRAALTAITLSRRAWEYLLLPSLLLSPGMPLRWHRHFIHNRPPPEGIFVSGSTMDITINLDLPSILSQAVSAERVQPLLDKAIGEAIKDAINSATGYRSEFRKQIEAQLTEGLPHGLELDDMAKFQQVLNQALTSAVHGSNAAAINVALAKAVQDVMPDTPAVMKLSELLQAARDGFNREDGGAFYALYEKSEYGGSHLYLDSNPSPGRGYGVGNGKYSAHYSLDVNGDGDVYALKMQDKQITPASRPTVISRFDSILMAMYVGRTRLEVDMDPDEVESAAGEQYD
ncbi:hypothetical protein [Ottowia sp. VDI28]|uniref:hypothetical protein n=1 Tax=Ottowia sp. VDI28 TaxID=3133968 RepID=UPI003C2BF52C